jgi:hypothetical protein
MGIILSFLIGLGLLRLVPGRAALRPLDIFLAWGLGAGVASQITFFSFLFGGLFRADLLMVLAFSAAFFIWVLVIKKRKKVCFESFGPGLAVFLVVAAPLIAAQVFIFYNEPYGGWDAWSLWNYRANSLFRSGGDWFPVYHNAVQGRHPWLLPHYIVWGWSFSGRESVYVPALSALAMSLATAGLLVYGLVPHIGRSRAALAGLYLVSIPLFNFHAAGQYASIFAAFYFLGAVIACEEYSRGPALEYAIIAGAFLAFLANTKDEGIVLVLLMLFFFRGFLKGMDVRHRKVFWGVFFSAIAMLVMTEVFMRVPLGMPFVVGRYGGVDAGLLLDPGRWEILAVYVVREVLLHPVTGWLFFLLAAALLRAGFQGPGVAGDRLRRPVLKTTAVFCLVFGLLYIMSTTDLFWRLSVTAHRLFFIFIPVIVYFMFKAFFWREGPRSPASSEEVLRGQKILSPRCY